MSEDVIKEQKVGAEDLNLNDISLEDKTPIQGGDKKTAPSNLTIDIDDTTGEDSESTGIEENSSFKENAVEVNEKKGGQSDAKQREPAEIWYSASLMRAIHCTKLGLFDVNMSNNSRSCNTFLHYLFNLEKEEGAVVEQEDILERIHPDDVCYFKTEMTKAITTYKPLDIRFRVVWRNGSVHHLQCVCDTHINEDGTRSFVGTAFDCTVFVQEQERSAQRAALKKHLEDEIKHRTLVARLLRTMSHEMRNPLMGLLSNVHSMQEILDSYQIETSAEKKQEYLSQIKDCIQNLSECAHYQSGVVSNLVDYSDVTQTNFESPLKKIRLSEIMTVGMRLFTASAKNKGLTLELVPLKRDWEVEVDEQSIKIILTNFIGNSIKFTDEGTISVEADIVQGNLVMKVSDSGVGVSDTLRDQLFKVERVPTATGVQDMSANGSGLGLYMCSRLAKQMKGTLTCTARDGGGTIMSLTVPVTVCDPPDTTRRESREPREFPENSTPSSTPTFRRGSASPRVRGFSGLSPKRMPSENAASPFKMKGYISPMKSQSRRLSWAIEQLKGKFVLAAEDNLINQKVLRRMLQDSVAGLTIVSDGLQAVENFSNGAKYDIVILDVHMPVMNGYQSAQNIREKSATTPIIFITGEISVTKEEMSKSYAPCSVLIKPCIKAELIMLSAELLELVA